MTTPPSGALRAACLLTALEPGAPRARIEDALVLLGQRAAALDDAMVKGLVRASSGRLDLVDGRVARSVVAGAAERERRRAHLALACVRAGDRATSLRSFDALCLALEPATSPVAGRRTPTTGTLTSRERYVAELAVTGARTSEIAAAAFLSSKTVEYHLTRIYRKLGVRSKAELIVAVRSGGLVTAGH